MRTILGIALVALVALGVWTMVDVDVNDTGALPEVSVEGGQLPDVDVQTGSIDVETEERVIEVPTIEVTPAPAD